MTINFKKYIEFWALLGLLVFILGFFIFPSSSKHNTVFYLTVCLPIALLIPFYYRKIKITSWVTLSVLVFAFYLFFNSLWSIHYSTEQSLRYLRYLLTTYCFFAAVFLCYAKKYNNTPALLKALLVAGFFHYSYGLIDHFNSHKLPFQVRYDDPIDSAMLAGILALISFWFALESIIFKKTLLYLTASLPFLAVLLLAKSRAPQLALLLTLPLLIYCHPRHIKKIAITSFIFIAILFISYHYLDAVKELFYRPSYAKGNYTSYRLIIWEASLKEGFEHFWFGQGASHKPPLPTDIGKYFGHSHSILLSVFRMGGILGFCLFLLSVSLCLLIPLKQFNNIERIWTIWLIFGLLCLLSNGRYPLFRPNAAWFAFWIPIAFICASCSHYLPIKYAIKK